MSGTKFYFAEFEISGTLPIQEQYDVTRDVEDRKRDALMEFLENSGPVVTYDDSRWYVGRVKPHKGLIYGKFGKTYTDEPTRYDEEIGDFINLEEKVTDADYSMFVIDYPNKVMAFSSTYRVRNSNFKTNFEKGFQNVVGQKTRLDLTLLRNEEELEEVLEEHPVYKLEAELRPTNPGPDPAFEDLDDSMQEMLVEKLGITAEAIDGEGINVHEDFLKQVTSMSMSEYGESWRVEYGDYEDGQGQVLKVISSEDEPATTRLEKEVEEIGGLRNYSNQLLDTARSFLN